MNVLILGQNDVNGNLANCLKGHGFHADVVEDVGTVRSFSGECGSFEVKAGSDCYNPEIVLVTEPVEKQKPDMGCSIFDGPGLKKISESGTKVPVVILLDYFNESPPEAAVRALEEAFALVSKKYNVVFLSKFMRTAGVKSEELYRKVRNAGVTFIKYEDIKITDDEVGFYNIEVSDGVNEISLSAKYIATDSGYGASDRFCEFSKKLRLSANEVGYVNEDRYFLGTALTSRKGVFFLNRDNWLDGVDYIVSECAKPDGEKNYAIVDGEKCAFCYTCYRACPHAAMEPDGEDRVMKNKKVACDGCGTCAAVCPGNAVTMALDDFTEAEMAGKSGKVKLFCCENSGEIVLSNILPELSGLAEKIDYEIVPCGGRIGFEQLSGALRFYGKVAALICMDDACRHFDGNKRVCLQAERLSGMLTKAGVNKGVHCIKTSHAMANAVKDEIRDMIVGGEL